MTENRMENSRRLAANKKKWDAWADTLDGDNWRNEYLRRSQRAVLEEANLRPGIALLDVGCGTGWALGQAAAMVKGEGEFYGVDLSERMIAKAKENFRDKPNFHFLRAMADAIPLEDGRFDAIICTNSFHHYLHPDKAVHEMARLLKPGGCAFILDPTADTLLIKIIDVIGRIVEPAHVKIYSTEEFRRMLTGAGLQYSTGQHLMKHETVHIGEKI